MHEDLELVRGVLNGSMESFNALISKYERPVYRFIYNITYSIETSQDITQEVFITVYNRLYTYRHDSKFSNWLFRIAKNKCMDYLRRVKRNGEISVELDESIASKEESPEQYAEYRETGRILDEFVTALKGTDRQILAMKYANKDMSFADVAEVLNMTESSVKKRYYRMRDKFKSLYQMSERS